ncbi:sigma-B regulation protein RsbU (phosphoserine phosphatase) [Tahibacter aquaticus]|uniref:Sigma-B regulation protein RsbU (Phosphoserine phosphatase) n=1 Tax=Tahibacter aquaticus TaxID=520092 RepID=A0A4R6Z4G4_9GAMM|nr:SpoIIE family protein phosphatase [Tahibacter aquaticus]TDR46521.1 sigma-B regulation protein RsbU (phosphoserine phosphatase) [Tahibacter aquaticus]
MSAADAHLLAKAAVGDDAYAFALLAELSEALAVSLDLRRTLPIAIQRIVDYMQVQAASLFLFDEETDELACKVCVGPIDVRGLRLGTDQGIVGLAFTQAAVQIVADAANDERVYKRIDEETGFVTHSLICVPLTAAKGTIGVLELINKLDGAAFDATDAGILRLLAVPTALAINNARMATALIEQQRLKREFDLARRLQKLLLPKRRRAGFPLLAVNVPAHEISGDFYDYFDLADGRIGFVIGDVSGKGLDAALLMTRAASLLRWAGKDGLAPDEWLRRANEELCQTTTGGRFVCAAVGYYERSTGEVRLAGAGFPPALLHGDGVYCEYRSDGPPLGIVAGQEYTETRLRLGGAALYFFSDGVTDVRVGDGRLGQEGVRGLIDRHASAPPEARLRLMVSELRQLRLVDDTTLLLLEEPRAQTAQVLLRQTFPAEAERLRSMRADLRLALQRSGVPADLRDRLVLAVDEACCNIIRHAYAGSSGDIVLSLRRDGDVLDFELRDDAPGVDPSRITPRDLAECRAGGLGVNFIDALMDGWRLQPQAGGVGNVLRMWKRCPAPLEDEA